MSHFPLLVWQLARPLPFSGRWLRLPLLLVLLVNLAGQAQPTPRQLTQFQQRLQRIHFDYRFWDASPDSLRHVLAGQRVDSLRFQTLEHLLYLNQTGDAGDRELLALATKLHYAEQAPLRLIVTADALGDTARIQNIPLVLDTLQAVQQQFDALGPVPYTPYLYYIRNAYDFIQQPKAKRQYFQRQLAYYQQHGPRENVAACYRLLAGYYEARGDYNQAIGYHLRAAELFRTFSAHQYYQELGLIGANYVKWGNNAHALPYLQQAATGPGTAASDWAFLNRAIANIHRQQGRYPLALRYATRALRPRSPGETVSAYDKVLGLVLQSATLLTLGRGAQVRPQLQLAQHLADSLQAAKHLPDSPPMPLAVPGAGEYCELAATWARYYAATGDAARAEAAWQGAYRQARLEQVAPLRFEYLHALASFYQQRAQPARAAPYALAALALADTLNKSQAATYLAQYELAQADRAQQARLAGLRRGRAQQATRARRQRGLLVGAVGGLVLLAGLAVIFWRNNRQKQQANAFLLAQKLRIEEQAARLGELDEVKNQFFANVSHELRTPLTLVLGPLTTLLTDPAQPLPAAVQQPVALAYRQAQRLLQLVNRLLDLTKLQAGRLGLHPVPTPLAALLRRVVGQFESLATERGIQLVSPATLPEELCLLLDADKVEEILTNLLINALNHTPAGGTVRLYFAWPSPEDSCYRVTVEDTGPGIAPAEQARVFERYYQSPQRQAQGGTGLGLALSRELALLLGGTLTLISELERGASFTLRFPAQVVPIPPTLAAAESAAPNLSEEPTQFLPVAQAATDADSRPRILVVEDDPDLCEYLRQLLAPSCEVLTAPDGQEALDLLAREAPFDLLTTDAMMPRLSGTELIARLRTDSARYHTASVPVLMLTARADEAHRLAALTVGVDDYLTKPFVPAELLARVHALLARQQVRRHFATLPPEEPVAEPGPTPLAPPQLPLAGPTPPAVLLAARRKLAPVSAARQLAQWQARVAERLADEHFGPTQLAELLCLGERTLYRRLGELAGLTPAAWLRELRLNQARQLLEAGGFGSVAAVADAVGFASPKYFAVLYAERFGRRPSEYTP